MKIATLVGGAAGLLLLIGLALQTDIPAMLRALQSGGWGLWWLLPYRSLFFALYALGWLVLLKSADPHRRAPFGYLFWVTSVREAVDRLLPVASVGGSFVGVRLMLWRGLEAATVTATVIAEIVLTLAASYVFAAVGLGILADIGAAHQEQRRVLLTLLASLPVPVAPFLLLRYGSVFERLGKMIRSLSGVRLSFDGAATLDERIKRLLHDRLSLSLAGALELTALASGSVETWFAMRLFGHPITVAEAVILESMTVALRHVAFIVPAGIGVQEMGLVLFGRALGIDSEFALAVSLVKRAREIIWGMPALLSWQWLKGRRRTRSGTPQPDRSRLHPAPRRRG